MPQKIVPLTDEEIVAVADDPSAVQKFTSDERRRLRRLKPPITSSNPNPKAAMALGMRSLDETAEDFPMMGGLVGGTAAAYFGPAASVAGAGAGQAGGEVLRRLAQGEPVASGEAAGDALEQGVYGATGQAIGLGAGKLIGAGAKAAGPWLMQKAVKPTQALLKEYGTSAQAIAKTLLDEGVSVTESGLAKLQRLLDATNDEIASAINSAPGSISRERVAARVLPTAAKFAEQVNPTKDLQVVGETVEEFMNHPISRGPMSVPEAQAIKVGTYRQIGKKYGEMSSASVETQKALARGLKEEIAAEAPEVARLNQKDAELMAALDAVGRRVALSGNMDPIGFAWVTHNPQTFLASLIDRNPVVKSYLARGLYTQAGRAAAVSPHLIRTAVSALASSHGPTDSSTLEPVASHPQE